MSLIYDKYKELKSIDNDTYYLFRSGNFYIFLGIDADRINQYVVLKRTTFCKNSIKCGFPVSKLDDYLKVFNNHGLNIKVIDSSRKPDILKEIREIDLDNLTPIKALNLLKKFKDSV